MSAAELKFTDGADYLRDDSGFPVEAGGGDILAIVEVRPTDPILAYCDGWNDARHFALEAHATHIASLEAQVAELEAALEPFAEFARVLDDSGDDETVLDYASEPADSIYINLGHVRAARATLAKKGQGHD